MKLISELQTRISTHELRVSIVASGTYCLPWAHLYNSSQCTIALILACDMLRTASRCKNRCRDSPSRLMCLLS